MLLMKESVLSCEEKTQPWFTYFQIAGKYYKQLTMPVHVY